MKSLKSQFLLDPDVVFLNHGSFGATPRPVFAVYQQWQRRLERQPVQFLTQELTRHLANARQALGRYLHADKDDLVFVPNATFALNVVAPSLPLQAGDEVLTTDHEYGACNNVWRAAAQQRGFRYVQQPIPTPVTTAVSLIDQLWQGVTPRTKVIYLSHISSATALYFPVAEICRRARAAGILTVIDGAHAPGQIPLDLEAIGADFYFGNAHKWLCSPKGAAFLHTRRARQAWITPPIIGWGWGVERAMSFGSDYLDALQWLGTNDLSAYLTVPDAIAFQEARGWTAVRAACHDLLEQTVTRVSALTGLPPLAPPHAGFYYQMVTLPLPQLTDPAAFKEALYAQYRIEAPIITWQERHFIRISVQGYNEPADLDLLLEALATLLPHYSRGSLRG